MSKVLNYISYATLLSMLSIVQVNAAGAAAAAAAATSEDGPIAVAPISVAASGGAGGSTATAEDRSAGTLVSSKDAARVVGVFDTYGLLNFNCFKGHFSLGYDAFVRKRKLSGTGCETDKELVGYFEDLIAFSRQFYVPGAPRITYESPALALGVACGRILNTLEHSYGIDVDGLESVLPNPLHEVSLGDKPRTLSTYLEGAEKCWQELNFQIEEGLLFNNPLDKRPLVKRILYAYDVGDKHDYLSAAAESLERLEVAVPASAKTSKALYNVLCNIRVALESYNDGLSLISDALTPEERRGRIDMFNEGLQTKGERISATLQVILEEVLRDQASSFAKRMSDAFQTIVATTNGSEAETVKASKGVHSLKADAMQSFPYRVLFIALQAVVGKVTHK